jgi:hypothetical protein
MGRSWRKWSVRRLRPHHPARPIFDNPLGGGIARRLDRLHESGLESGSFAPAYRKAGYAVREELAPIE